MNLRFKMNKFNKRKPSTQISRTPISFADKIIIGLTPLVSLYIVEILNQVNPFREISLQNFLLNYFWYLIVFCLIGVTCGRWHLTSAVLLLLSYLFGMMNNYTLRFRGRMFFPADILAFQTAANVDGSYDYSFDRFIIQGTLLFVCYFILICTRRSQWCQNPTPRVCKHAVYGTSTLYILCFFCTGMLANLGLYTQQWVPQSNGFLLNFTVALRYSAVDKTEDYSEDYVLKLLSDFPANEGDITKMPTNILVIMNESLTDLTEFEDLEISEDPMPYLRELMSQCYSGTMYSPVTGGGTASVEFEALTGFSTYFQPPHVVGYQLYVQEGMPSLAEIAKSVGYETHAFHPYKPTGWNRPVAYDYLSFQHQYYEDDVENPYMIRNYVSELSTYQKIIEITEEAAGEPTFMFTVTMQNHSSYDQGWNNLEETVELLYPEGDFTPAINQYFSLLRESDIALEFLIDYYENIDEPTIILFFGDHHPPLDNAFYETLYGKTMTERNTEEILQHYAVPFFLWGNYDIPSLQNQVISANYLSVLLTEVAGLPQTSYLKFLSELQEVLPVISTMGAINSKQQFVTEVEMTKEELWWLEAYKMLNYCGMEDLFSEAVPYYRNGA